MIINKNNKLKIIIILTSIFYSADIVHASNDLSDFKVYKILKIIENIGYGICIIGLIIDLIRGLIQRDIKFLFKIIIKYALAFFILYNFPRVLNTIKYIF